MPFSDGRDAFGGLEVTLGGVSLQPETDSFLFTKNLFVMANLKGIDDKMIGSAGAWTFYQRLGTTVAKEKVTYSRNQRHCTDAQLKGRMGWANMVAFWRQTRGCLQGAFNNKRAGQTDFNLFVSLNYGREEVYLTAEMVRMGACVASPYLLSCGRLDTIEVSLTDEGRYRTDIALGEDMVIDGGTTIGEFSRAVVEHNPQFMHGDMICCLGVRQVTGDDGIPRVEMRHSMVQIDAYSRARLQGNGDAMVDFASVEGCLGSTGPLYGGMAWIHSRAAGRYSREQVIVSTQRLVLSGPEGALEETPDRAFRTPEAYEAAAESYRRRMKSRRR